MRIRKFSPFYIEISITLIGYMQKNVIRSIYLKNIYLKNHNLKIFIFGASIVLQVKDKMQRKCCSFILLRFFTTDISLYNDEVVSLGQF